MSRRNCEYAEEIGANPYLRLNKDIDVAGIVLEGLVGYDLQSQEKTQGLGKKYHTRSSAETAFLAIERKLGHQLS